MKQMLLEKTIKKSPPKTVCEKINKKLKEYKSQNPGLVSYRWNKDSNKFTIKSSVVSGEIKILNGKIQVYVDKIPLIFKPFKNKYIKKFIEDEIANIL